MTARSLAPVAGDWLPLSQSIDGKWRGKQQRQRTRRILIGAKKCELFQVRENQWMSDPIGRIGTGKRRRTQSVLHSSRPSERRNSQDAAPKGSPVD
jgi:hypothetical protein